MRVESDLVSLQDLSADRFTIPIYQRLYVWGEDQVRTLLEDLNNAFQQGKEIYFLGGVLLVQRKDSHGDYYELIDGQQRFTTLWLLSAAWRQCLEGFLSVQVEDQNVPRVRFDIRPEVDAFMWQHLAQAETVAPKQVVKATKFMSDAMATMASFLNNQDEQGESRKIKDLIGLTKFIFEQVKMVRTTVPPKTDMNKLFEIINNRGVQLQHHEILKARMLEALGQEERGPYAALWDACADMGDFVERSLREMTQIKVSALFDSEQSLRDAEPLASAPQVLVALRGHASAGELERRPLEDILKEPLKDEAPNKARDDGVDDDRDRVRGIFGFPVLLQHVLRIWLKERGKGDLPRILDRELLELFANHFFQDGESSEQCAAKARSFIELLWEIRYRFDKHIIKWVDLGEEEQHLICPMRLNTSKGNTYLIRDFKEDETARGGSRLQGMLYHSQQITTQYWLTPLLYFMWKNAGEPSSYYAYLRHLDNHLLCSNEEEDLVKRTRWFMDDPWRRTELNGYLFLASEDEEKKMGTQTPHYWFYKLEFVLWYQNRYLKEWSPADVNAWKAFRFTAKNSVEHVSPQTGKDVDQHRVTKAMLDDFGNLALVSRSINSEYGNKPFTEKREHFMNRNRNRVDSLKLRLIYDNKEWNDRLAREHKCQMLDALQEYFGDVHDN